MSATPATPPVSSFPRWQQALIGLPGILISGLWGFAEAAFFFIIPDVFLSLAAVLKWPRTWKHVLSAVVGATVGGTLLFHLAAANQQNARAAVIRVPFIRERMLAKVSRTGSVTKACTRRFGVPSKAYRINSTPSKPRGSPARAGSSSPPLPPVLSVFCSCGALSAASRPGCALALRSAPHIF